ncbi:tail tube protein [Lysinibacillus phage vB_LfM_LysYB1]|nr:tail tube protein [Lysinibacillus phage vB_LfM_LysYB1]WAB25251.1 tail tube protein [Lysinibacillus phage vB_LfM_LysYB2]
MKNKALAIKDEFLAEQKRLPLKLDLQFFATQEKQTVHSGATVLLMIGNKVVGKAQGIDGRRSFGTEGVYEIGTIMPTEHVYNRYEGSVSIDKFFLKKDNLKSLGFAALGEEVLKLDILDIVVVSKADNSVIRAYRGCSIQDYSENFRANSIAGENASFVYLKASDSK